MSASRNLPRIARSPWAAVKMGPPDAILGVTEAFNRDVRPVKVALGVGAYRDGEGKPFVLSSVRKAEQNIVAQRLNKEYLPITGLASFNSHALSLAYSPASVPLQEKRVSSTSTISGTGALRVGAEFLAKHFPGNKEVFMPSPTWGNHVPIFANTGLKVSKYRYFDPKTLGVDIEGLLTDLNNAPNQSIVLLHACAHNPSGCDPTQEEWRKIEEVVRNKNHFAFFDMAYQGFASGDADKDAYAVRYFVEKGHQIALSQSFAKNMGLYGERAGLFSLVTGSSEEKDRVDSQLKIVIRPLYSSPPMHGARIATEVMSNPELRKEWLEEVKVMANRIIDMRKILYDILVTELKNEGPVGNGWAHCTQQIGMFCFSGLKPEHVDTLARDHAIYMTRDGRISMAGVTEHNVRHLAESIDKVLRESK